jgi:CubicO group peptidase (beta-lactamase class C family)
MNGYLRRRSVPSCKLARKFQRLVMLPFGEAVRATEYGPQKEGRSRLSGRAYGGPKLLTRLGVRCRKRRADIRSLPVAAAVTSVDRARYVVTDSFVSGATRFARAAGVRAACLLWVVLAIACGGPIRQLHPLGGDEFTLFPVERRSPPPLDCTGTDEQRFACLAKQAERISQEQDVAGAFAVATPDGNIRALALGDTLNRGVHVSTDTRFPVGSVSKMFLAAAAVSLSLEGALDLQRPIARYLPELSLTAGVGQATLHQLLTHSAGLGNPPQCQKAEDDLDDLLTRYGQQPLWVAPGVLMNYSNLGYSFVALVLERVTGKPFEQVVREHVLTPAGLGNGTFGPDRAVVRGHRAGRSSRAVARCGPPAVCCSACGSWRTGPTCWLAQRRRRWGGRWSSSSLCRTWRSGGGPVPPMAMAWCASSTAACRSSTTPADCRTLRRLWPGPRSDSWASPL